MNLKQLQAAFTQLFAGKKSLTWIGLAVVSFVEDHASANAAAIINAYSAEVGAAYSGPLNWQALITAIESVLTGLNVSPTVLALLEMGISLLAGLIPSS